MGLRRRKRRSAEALAKAQTDTAAALLKAQTDEQIKQLATQAAQDEANTAAVKAQADQNAAAAQQQATTPVANQAMQSVSNNMPMLQSWVANNGDANIYRSPEGMAAAGALQYNNQVYDRAKWMQQNDVDTNRAYAQQNDDVNSDENIDVDAPGNFDDYLHAAHGECLKDIQDSPFFGSPGNFDSFDFASVLHAGGAALTDLNAQRTAAGEKPVASWLQQLIQPKTITTPAGVLTVQNAPTQSGLVGFFKKNFILLVIVGVVVFLIIKKMKKK